MVPTLLPQWQQEIVRIRRALHKIPEIGFEEHQTQRFILDTLAQLEGWQVEPMCGTGVKAVWRSPSATRTIALRTDIDALNIPEQTGLDFASTRPGFMHACRHDGHMAWCWASPMPSAPATFSPMSMWCLSSNRRRNPSAVRTPWWKMGF
nr:hypothetical protein [bacterium]